MELKLERRPQKFRAIRCQAILGTIEYEVANEHKVDDILDIVIGIRDTAERIIRLILKTDRKFYEMPSGAKLTFEYDENGVGKISIEAMDRLMELAGAKEIDYD